MLAVPMIPQRTAVTLSPPPRPGLWTLSRRRGGVAAQLVTCRPLWPPGQRGYDREECRAGPNVEDTGVNESASIPGAGYDLPGATAGLFRGVGVALVTIFGGDGEIDPGATGKLAADLVARGMQAVLVNGSTGEAATLTGPERVALVEAVRGTVPPG